MSKVKDSALEAVAPVAFIEPDRTEGKGPEPGVSLCLSGGGYRAMLFHVGAIWRLNEARVLHGLQRISSVSGGSITAGILGLRWKELRFEDGVAQDLVDKVVVPIRRLASKTIDAEAIVTGMILPGSISDKIARAYDRRLFDSATLADLPNDDEGPRFVINATNLQSGALWRFSRPYMADYLVGRVLNPTVPLAVAVAASSAFPPVLSPVELELDPDDFESDPKCPLQKPPFTTNVILSDGGVYDNLGLETVWKRYRTVLVSDAGGKMAPEPEPKRDWGRQAYRVLNVIDNQVRSLRKRQLIAGYENPDDEHDGTYWGIGSNIDNYGLPDPLPCPVSKTRVLAEVPTRLKRLPDEIQERLINWGYAVCDAALRRYIDPGLTKPGGFPYPGGVG